MEIISASCNHCGASLQIPESARFVTCRYCKAQLEITRTDSTISTQVLQRIDDRTAAMAQDLHAIRRETELERLDREWEQTRSSLMTRNRNGNQSVPSKTAGIGIALLMGGFGLLWTIFAIVITTPDNPHMPNFPGMPPMPAPEPVGPPAIVRIIFPLFGIGFVITAIVMGIKTAVDGQRYEQELARYQERRRQLLTTLPSDPSEVSTSNPPA